MAHVTWKSTRYLSLSFGYKLAKYERRVPFELGRCLDEVDASAFCANVWTFSVEVSASFSKSLLKMSLCVGSFSNGRISSLKSSLSSLSSDYFLGLVSGRTDLLVANFESYPTL